MRFLLALALLFNIAWAAEVQPLKVLPQNQGIIFTKTPGMAPKKKLLVYRRGPQGLALEGLLEVVVCKEKYCRANVQKLRPNVKLDTNLVYSTTRLDAAKVAQRPRVDAPRKEAPRTQAPKTAAKPGFAPFDALYIGLGGPFGNGLQLSYLMQREAQYWWGVSAGYFSSTTDKIGFSGQFISGVLEYILWRNESGLSLNPNIEMGIFRGVIDFTDVDAGPIVTHMGPLVIAGVSLRQEFDSWFFSAGLGYSYNIIPSSFLSEGQQYQPNVAGGMLTFKAGLGLKF
jgi:hypothetical protein